jgi:hypothetical protein
MSFLSFFLLILSSSHTLIFSSSSFPPPTATPEESEKADKERAEKTKEMDESIESDFVARINAITPESISLEINPNVFLGFKCDEDPAVVAKDEETARSLAAFLCEDVLPAITHQVRTLVFALTSL